MSVVIVSLIVAYMVTVHSVSRAYERVSTARAKSGKDAASKPARTPWSQRGEARKFFAEVHRDVFAQLHGGYTNAKRKHGEKQARKKSNREAGIDDRGPVRRVAGDLTAGARAWIRADWNKAWDKKRRQMRERWPDFPWPEWSGMADDEDTEKPKKDGGQADADPKSGEGEKPSESPEQETAEPTEQPASEPTPEATDTGTTAGEQNSDTAPAGGSEPAATTNTDTDPATASNPEPEPVTDTSTEGAPQTVTATQTGASEYGTLTGIINKIDEHREKLQTNAQRARDLVDAAKAYEDEAPEIADAADQVDRAMTALDDEAKRLQGIVADAQELNAMYGNNLSQSSMDYNRDE